MQPKAKDPEPDDLPMMEAALMTVVVWDWTPVAWPCWEMRGGFAVKAFEGWVDASAV